MYNLRSVGEISRVIHTDGKVDSVAGFGQHFLVGHYVVDGFGGLQF
jgi:hypothetical protein